MHYITGTRISIKPNPNRGFRSRENSFTVNTQYALSHISKQSNNTLGYTFTGADRSSVTLSFETARQADAFIAKLRGEVIPDYDNRKESEDL
jgi:hypothetical protein